MVSVRSGKVEVMRRWVAAVLLGGTTLAATGCSLLPTNTEIKSAASLVKDTMTGKARRDKQNKMYAEARILERRKEFPQAERLYRELLVAQPKSRDCYHRLAVIASVQGKYPEAQQLYQAALSCSEPTPDLLSDVGYCHYLQQEMPQAEQALRAAVQLQPQHAAALNNLARVVGEQGNLEEAYDLFRRAGDEAAAECNFAYLCAQCGDLPNAQTHFSRALSVNPDLRPAAEALLQVTQAMQRRQDEAQAQFAAAQANAAQQQAAAAQQPNGAQQASAVQQAAALQPNAALQQPVAPQPMPVVQNAGGVTFAGGYENAVAAQGSGMQLASHNVQQASVPAPQSPRLMEVYRGSPRTAAASAQIAAASRPAAGQAQPVVPTAPATPAPTPPGAPASFPQPPVGQSVAPAPFSFPATPTPQYLQPSLTSRFPKSNGGEQGHGAEETGAVLPASYSAPARGIAAPNPGAQPAGLTFPSTP